MRSRQLGRASLPQLGSVTLLALAAAAFLLALRIDWVVGIWATEVSRMRRPGAAPLLAQTVLCALGGVLVVFGLLGNRLLAAIREGAKNLARMQLAPFWLAVASLATAVRLPIALLVPYEPVADGLWYHEAATSLAKRGELAVDGQLTAFRSPGYAWLLSQAYRLLGPELAWAWIVGGISTALILVASHAAARRLYDEPTARLATVMLAAHPALALMTGQAMSDLAFVAGLMVLLSTSLSAPDWTWKRLLLLGLGLGALILVRSVALALLPVWVWLWFRQGAGWRAVLRRGLVVAIGISVLLGPWIARNQMELGRATIGTNLGTNLYFGNHPGATGGVDPAWTPGALAAHSEVERSDALVSAALDYMRSHPGEVLARDLLKVARLYALDLEAASSLTQGEAPGSTIKIVLMAICQTGHVLLMLAFLARVCSWRARGSTPAGLQWLGWWVGLLLTGVCAALLATDRYRLPILPWMVLEVAVWFSGYARAPTRQALLGRAHFQPARTPDA